MVKRTWVCQSKPGARTPQPWQEKQIKIEQVMLSARLTREDKVMLSSFRKTLEVLLDWYLNNLLLEEKFALPVMTPVLLKKPNFFEGNLRVWSEFRLSAICCQTFPLSVALALKRYGSVMRTSRAKARFWSSDHSITELKLNKIKLYKKTPEGVYAGCVGLRKNYGYVGWQWKVE